MKKKPKPNVWDELAKIEYENPGLAKSGPLPSGAHEILLCINDRGETLRIPARWTLQAVPKCGYSVELVKFGTRIRDGAYIEPLKVRMALHTGTADFRGGDYFGPALIVRCRWLHMRQRVTGMISSGDLEEFPTLANWYGRFGFTFVPVAPAGRIVGHIELRL